MKIDPMTKLLRKTQVSHQIYKTFDKSL